MSDTPRALYIGRFQPFHWGHSAAVEAIMAAGFEPVIVIGSADKSYTYRNPFTAGERYEMIRAWAETDDLQDRIHIIPVDDINRFALYPAHIMSHVPDVHALFTAELSAFGTDFYDARPALLGEVRLLKLFEREKYSASRVRMMIATKKDGWEKLVPTPVADVIKDCNGVQRLISVIGGAD